MNKTNTQTTYRQELRLRILRAASEQFHAKGIRAVKMDDIAGILSISKRTMYEIYENKEQLLMASVREDNLEFDVQMQEYIDNGYRSVIDLMLEFFRLKMNSLANINPLYFAELNRYPEVIEWVKQKHQQQEHQERVFFQQGIREGYFRPDANYELLSKVGSGTMSYIMEHQLYKQYEPGEIFKNVGMLFLRGVCTLKGIREFDSRIMASGA